MIWGSGEQKIASHTCGPWIRERTCAGKQTKQHVASRGHSVSQQPSAIGPTRLLFSWARRCTDKEDNYGRFTAASIAFPDVAQPTHLSQNISACNFDDASCLSLPLQLLPRGSKTECDKEVCSALLCLARKANKNIKPTNVPHTATHPMSAPRF